MGRSLGHCPVATFWAARPPDLSAKRARIAGHFQTTRARRLVTLQTVNIPPPIAGLVLWTLGSLCTALAQTVLPEDVGAQVQQLARSAGSALAPRGARIEIEAGTLDPRLRLAPCGRVEPYLPAGVRPWGRTRIGLRCTDGMTAWNVYLPLTVHVWANAVVVAVSLPAGAVLEAEQLQTAEVDWAAPGSNPHAQADALVGRALARPLMAGQPVRQADLKARQWFAAGETVSIVAVGPGFAVRGEGQALSNGLEGQLARVRTESGRVLSGTPTGERRIEVPL